MERRQGGNKFVCSGALVESNLVLTTATCLKRCGSSGNRSVVLYHFDFFAVGFSILFKFAIPFAGLLFLHSSLFIYSHYSFSFLIAHFISLLDS